MSGTEKFPMLVIGKSANPRCFKNKEVPVKYRANSKAWMTGDIFEEVLKTWDRQLGSQGRKVLLFLDNCSAHPSKVKLDNIRMVFFPPNTTARSQVGFPTRDHYNLMLLANGSGHHPESEAALQEVPPASSNCSHGWRHRIQVQPARLFVSRPKCVGSGERDDDQELLRKGSIRGGG